MNAIPLIVIAGPTGVGKTRLAIELAQQLDGEIVGADSRQIYRSMDIGTAKPTPEERARVPHHLIDIRDPDEDYSAAEFARDASTAIQHIYERGKLPFLVGGTGLYIQSVLYGIFEGPGRAEVFRENMRKYAEQYGAAALHQELLRLDPATAKRLNAHDLVRIVRALEVYHLTGIPISQHQASATVPLAQYRICFLALTMERSALYARINDRVEQMIAQGLVDEVRSLLQRGYDAGLNAMHSPGYKEICEYLAGTYDLPSAIALIQRDTRRYAKRQLTWFRKYQDSVWIDLTQCGREELRSRCLTVIARLMNLNADRT